MTSTQHRPRLGRLVPALALLVSAAGAVATPALADPDDIDPRSGAALNREQAGDPSSAPPPLFAAPDFINPQSVNDPSADATAQDTQSETTIAVDGADVVVGWNDSGSFTGNNHFTGYASSANRGTDFTDHGALPNSAEGDAGDPVLAVDNATDAFYLATLGFTTNENLQVFKSTNGGATFGAPANGTPGYAGSGDFQDKEWMTVDNFAGPGQGNVYLCWTNFGADAEIRFTSSTDGGATFAPNLGMLIAGGGNQNQGCYVSVGPDHAIYVFYFSGSGGDNKLFVRKSTDQGATFSPAGQIADLVTTTINGSLGLGGGFRSNSFPHAAVNPSNGDLHVVFNDNPADADVADAYMVTSNDNGATWTPPAKINDDDNGRDQFFPTVAVNASGNQLMVGYYSRSHDPSNSLIHRRGRLARVTGTGELHWRDSFQLGPDTPVVIGQDPVINSTYMGDYDQIATGGKYFYSSFSDNRDGDSFHANQPDVFHARVLAKSQNTNVAVSVAAPATKPVGDQFTIKVTATNTGTKKAQDVYLNDRLPPELTIVSVSTAGGGCDQQGRLVSCRVDGLASGASKTMEIKVVGTTAGTFADSARVTTSSDDSTNGDDTDNESVTITG